jgi:outer membrane protein assembly factor BamB
VLPRTCLSIFDWAVSEDGRFAVVVDCDATAHVLHLEQRGVVGRFSVSWDNGGSRVALSSDGKVCATGTYGRGGTAGYALPSGRPLWHRPELTRVQRIVCDPRQGNFIVARQDRRAACVAADNGNPIRELGHVRKCVASLHDDMWLIDGRSLKVVASTNLTTRVVLQRGGFSMLAGCLSPTAAYVSECAGPLRAFDLKSGRMKWLVACDKEHWTCLAYSHSTDCVYAFRYAYETAGPTHLDAFDPETGDLRRTVIVPGAGPGGCFFRDATRAFVRGETILDTATGEVVVSLGAIGEMPP